MKWEEKIEIMAYSKAQVAFHMSPKRDIYWIVWYAW